MQLDFTRLDALAFTGVMETDTAPQKLPSEIHVETHGNLALAQAKDDEYIEPNLKALTPYDETKVLPFSVIGSNAQKKAARGEYPRDCILRAFKRSCEVYHVSFSLGEDEQGRPRVALTAPREYETVRYCLSVELEHKPWLEVALLWEVAQKDARLMDILEERAGIRRADGLTCDLESVALLTIGAEERMAEWERERAEFHKALKGSKKKNPLQHRRGA